MSKQTKEPKATVHRGASKVATAVAKVYDTVENNGSVVTQCVTAARQVYKGKAIPKLDLAYIIDNVARIRQWTAASLKQRSSEVRIVLRAYDRLPEAMEKYCAKSDGFTWHDAIKLARCLGREPAVNVAVRLALHKNQAKTVTPLARIGGAISRIMNTETRIARVLAFQIGLESLAEKHGMDW